MKKTLYSDEWGEIREYTRFRGKGGRFVTAKYGRSKKGQASPYLKTEKEQWRISEGHRTERITIQSPDRVMKSTYPGAVADNENDIWESLRSTNVFTQIGKAATAIFNVRGINRRGQEVRLQGEITLGEHNQDQQLAMAINEVLRDNNYGEENYYGLMKARVRGRTTRRSKTGLTDTQISVTLLR
jgi:hypothetical protein